VTSARTCAFCATALAPGARVCPMCAYPVGGEFRGDAKRPAQPKRRPPPRKERCPQCGAQFPAGRSACPQCGSDAQTGWKPAEEIAYQEADVPEFDDAAYEDAVAHLRVARPSFWRTPKGRRMAVGLLVVAALTVPAVVALWRLLR
jgi:RNA polymerase subunit RPABC4/transcription elongation factor Spt4